MSFKFDFVRLASTRSCTSACLADVRVCSQNIPEEELEALEPVKASMGESASSQGSPTPPASMHAVLASNSLENQVSQLNLSGRGQSNGQTFDSTSREVTMDELVRSRPLYCQSTGSTFLISSSSS